MYNNNMPFILEQMMGLRLWVNSIGAARGVVKAMCLGGGGGGGGGGTWYTFTNKVGMAHVWLNKKIFNNISM
jgi:hypothetical protein